MPIEINELVKDKEILIISNGMVAWGIKLPMELYYFGINNLNSEVGLKY